MTKRLKIGIALGISIAVILAVVVIGAAAGVGAGFGAPGIPHGLQGRSDCVSCHGDGGANPYPAWHAERGYDNGRCGDCHDADANADDKETGS